MPAEKIKAGPSIVRYLLDWRNVTLYSWGVAVAIILLGSIVLSRYLGHVPDFYLGLLAVFGTPWMILPCVLIIVHREMPRRGMPGIRGIWAVIGGWLGLLTFGAIEIAAIYYLVAGWLTK